jgi:hypothetical protein
MTQGYILVRAKRSLCLVCGAARVDLAREFAVGVRNSSREGGAPKSLPCGVVVSLVVASSMQGVLHPFIGQG